MDKKIKQWIENTLGFSPQEVNGFLILGSLLVATLLLPLVVKYGFPTNGYTGADYKQDQAMLAQALAEIKVAEAQSTVASGNFAPNDGGPIPSEVANIALKSFNPNLLTVDQWRALGLKLWLAERIVKYRSKGGQFRIKRDLQKIYGFPPAEYQRLIAFIDLPENFEREKSAFTGDESTRKTADPVADPRPRYSNEAKRVVAEKFDLNLADTAQLATVRGIGSVLSARIVKFRSGLGGFHQLEQLQEIYGLSPETLAELQKMVTLAPTPEVKTLNINTADVNTLKVHTYIGYKLAQVIVNYRAQHGPYATAEDLLKTKLIDAAKIAKLKPYLAF